MKCFIIHLPNYEKSVERATVALNSGLNLGWPVELFNGVDGKTVESFEEWNRWGISINQQNKKCRELFNRPGVRGCFLSHWNLWQYCASQNETIGIFEHDIEFIKPYQEIPLTFKHILKLEGFKLNKPRPAGNWYEGARAYILKPIGATKLISWIKQNGCLPADVNIGSNILDITLDLSNCVKTTVNHENKQDSHVNSFTWNLNSMS